MDTIPTIFGNTSYTFPCSSTRVHLFDESTSLLLSFFHLQSKADNALMAILIICLEADENFLVANKRQNNLRFQQNLKEP